jgi:hypothetical protein
LASDAQKTNAETRNVKKTRPHDSFKRHQLHKSRYQQGEVDEDSDNEIKRMILRVINERKEVTRIA